MDVELVPASVKDKSVLRNLLELCQHDYSEFNDTDVDEHALFGYEYLDHYWTEKGRHAFLVKASGQLAGFVLIRKVDGTAAGETHSIAEFFILRKYRHQGLGQTVAFKVFDMFPGRWSISQEEGNTPAQSFWRRVISEYTDGNYEEVRFQNPQQAGFTQKFSTRKG